jgi:hypothetical protein
VCVERERKKQKEEKDRPSVENIARHRLGESAAHCVSPFLEIVGVLMLGGWGGGQL